jgi:hypothetical protein
MATIKVLAHKSSTAPFEVTADSRKEAEQAIAERLLPDKELVWNDDPEGINVVCIMGNEIWRPRRRFFLTNDGSRPLMIEDKSDEVAE